MWIYLLRHGSTEYNAQKRYQGQRDIPLSPESAAQLRRADFLLCASQKQRDFWLGQLAGQGRVNPVVYDEDASLDALIAVVPFGIPDEPPVQRRSAIRRRLPTM